MNTSIYRALFAASALSLPMLTACGGGGLVGISKPQTALSGSAAGGTSVDADSSLQRCNKTLGTIAVDDGRNADWYQAFGAATQITSIEPLLRLAVQQSNCFVITSIGNQRTDSGLSRMTDAQRNSGEYRAGSKQQKGQRVAADYYLEPSIVINNSPTGSLAGAVGGMITSVLGSSAGAIAGNLQTRASVVTMTLFDIRSAVQIAASQGSSTATNYGAVASAFGGGDAGALSGYSKTPEGKATVAAFIDAYNSMVIALRSYKAQEVEGGLGTGGTLEVN